MQRKAYLFLVLIFTLLLLWWRFPDFFSAQTNQRFIEPWGDGYKAYHAIFYHIEHDSTLSHFQGMNYPYGEHIVPGACQPLFSNGIKILASLGINLIPYERGLLHSFLMLGLLLCAVFLYLLFVRLKLPPWYSLLLAIGITFLAPQVDRMVSHYGLAHPELLPMVFYFLLRWHEKQQWKWSLGLGAVVLAYSLVHFYYFAILTFAIVGWVGVRWLLQRDWKATPAYLGHGLLMLGWPLLFFYAWMIYPETVTDRNAVPWGFFHYRSKPSGVFTDMSQPHWQFIDRHLTHVHVPDMEAKAYIGLVAIVFLLFFIFKGVQQKLRTWPLATTTPHEYFLKYLLISGIIILIFASGIPFIFPYGEKLLKYMGPIQQFRSIGRFAWIFFYTANICTFYYLYQWSQTARKTSIKWTLLLLPLAILLLESYHYNWAKPIDLDEVENWEEGEYFTDRPIDYERYQACIPIPYFNIGSDNFWWEPTGWISQKPHTLSMQTGLPLTSAMLTRTSLSQTLNQLQLVTEPYRRPRIFDDLPNDKPFLLFWDSVRVQEHGDLFTHLKDETTLLYANDWLHLYELPLASFQQRLENKIQAVKAALDTLPMRYDDWQSSDSLAQWYYADFDDQAADGAYFGKGELAAQMGYWNRLMDTVWVTNYTGDLTISFWQYLNSDRSARTTITWTEYDAQTGSEIFKQERISWQNVKAMDDQGWGLIEFTLPRQQANSRIELIITNKDKPTGPLRVDELLVRPGSVNIGRKSADGWWYNDRWYPKSLLE
ncbi:hypothetical protein [Lewinella sp. LCG006]|uniref:hypothetical protein n=1 Tax=Lewinella sp. LCG006 TaxID=3231911 RepID=UPI0034608425